MYRFGQHRRQSHPAQHRVCDDPRLWSELPTTRNLLNRASAAVLTPLADRADLHHLLWPPHTKAWGRTVAIRVRVPSQGQERATAATAMVRTARMLRLRACCTPVTRGVAKLLRVTYKIKMAREFGYRSGSLNSRTRFQYRDESPQAPMSQFGGDRHDHSQGDGHSHGSHDQATTSPDARQSRCPVDGATLGSRGRPAALLVDGQPVYLCSEQCMMQLLQKSGHDSPDHSTDESESFGSPSEEHDHSHSH